MRRWNRLAWLCLTCLLLAGCGGSDYTGGDTPPESLGALDFAITADAGSTIDPSSIEGELISVEDALEAKAVSALPAGFVGRQGLLLTPFAAPGTGFSGTLRTRVTTGDPAAGEYDGVLLYLYYIDPATHTATIMNTGRGDAGNSVSFHINALGYFVIAENTAIPRPGGLAVRAYADLATAPAGTDIHFWAVVENGTAPFTYEWDFNDGYYDSRVELHHTYYAPGTYTVTLTVTDATGVQAPAVSTPIEITAGSVPLELQGVDVVPGSASHLQFNYAVTLSGGTGPFAYEWTFDDAAPGAVVQGSAAQEHTFAAPGLYSGLVMVSDSTGAEATGYFVSDARSLLLYANPMVGSTPLQVEFTLVTEGTTAEDVTTLDFGDGEQQVLTGQVALHTYNEDGLFSASARSSRVVNGETYTCTSDPILIQAFPAANIPFIQLTQPLVPDPSQPFDIVGYNFGDTAAYMGVMLGVTQLEILSWSDNIVRVQVPQGSALTGGWLTLTLYGEPVGDAVQVTLNTTAHPASIQNVIPRRANPGERVLVTGHGFPASASVQVGGQTAVVEQRHANGIVAVLPGDLVPGPYDLEVRSAAGGSLSFAITIASIQYTETPELISATPPVQEIGHGDIVLSGLWLGTMDTSIVYAEGYALPRSLHSSSSITLITPGPSIDSWACVISRNRVTNALPLAFMLRPSITQVTPTEALINEVITIAGQNFGTQVEGDEVVLGQVPLEILTWTGTKITARIPKNAQTGQLAVLKKLASNAVELRIKQATGG